MTAKCKQCGKPFPIGQEWCNWCEPGRKAPPPTVAPVVIDKIERPGAVTEGGPAATEQPELGVVGSAFVLLLRLFVVGVGLLFIVGGGMIGYCAGGAGPSAYLVLVFLGGGCYVISFAFSENFGGPPDTTSSEQPPPTKKTP